MSKNSNISVFIMELLFLLFRKHRGGIKLSGEHSEATVQEELSSSTLSEDLTTEPSTEIESHKEQKHKADSLWANFLNDVANVPRKSQFKSTVSINHLITYKKCLSISIYTRV